MSSIVGNVALGFASGDTVVITGAGSGIGRATALHAAGVGLQVAAWDLDLETACATEQAILAAGGEALAVKADVTSPGEVAAAFERSASLGEARYLVNNAGPASASGPERDFDVALAAAVGSVHLVTDTWLSRQRPAHSALVNVSSVAGNLMGTASPWYPTAKSAIMGYTRHLAAYRSDEVRANAVAPGMTDTPRMVGFADSEGGQRMLTHIPLGRLATPDEIAWTILFLLSPLASYVNGTLLVADGGWSVAQ